jgi:hypothetical protein
MSGGGAARARKDTRTLISDQSIARGLLMAYRDDGGGDGAETVTSAPRERQLISDQSIARGLLLAHGGEGDDYDISGGGVSKSLISDDSIARGLLASSSSLSMLSSSSSVSASASASSRAATRGAVSDESLMFGLQMCEEIGEEDESDESDDANLYGSPRSRYISSRRSSRPSSRRSGSSNSGTDDLSFGRRTVASSLFLDASASEGSSFSASSSFTSSASPTHDPLYRVERDIDALTSQVDRLQSLLTANKLARLAIKARREARLRQRQRDAPDIADALRALSSPILVGTRSELLVPDNASLQWLRTASELHKLSARPVGRMPEQLLRFVSDDLPEVLPEELRLIREKQRALDLETSETF